MHTQKHTETVQQTAVHSPSTICVVIERLLNKVFCKFNMIWWKILTLFELQLFIYQVPFYFKSFRCSKGARKRSDKTFESLLSLLLCCCWPSQHWVDCLGASGRPDCWTDTMTEVLSFSLSQFPGSDATSRRPQILVRANDVSVTLWTNALSGEDSERQLTGTMAFIWGLDHVPKRTGRNG